MLNSVSDPSITPADGVVRRRLSAVERRRQLISIGLAQVVETPIQDLSMDEVAAEAGISRSLLFHYFPTKTEFYVACIGAAGRRILRTTAPDPELPGEAQVRQMLQALVEQIARRRSFWLALVHGHGVTDPRVSEVVSSVLAVSTDRVVEALGLEASQRPVVHAWWAYVEDRALTWSLPRDPRVSVAELVEECEAALTALLEVSRRRER
ncbi:TetR/AcrR family transcriptional regulator [Nocardioides seonyuensis]|uniref:TetR/AcrR family transcriptional regulator n=1 Tax=Nocardioides seonyuensis TaxID=2518371 RepID=A0A4P7IGN4_9ACTN|nr:TetR/AcrR family transcriptional regulator [Nocardioides seonyuensis]